jgi:DNA-binding protein YbaB
MQAIMKQAQKLQADMLKEKTAIDETIYEVEKSFVKVSAKGNKKIETIKINLEEVSIEDLEIIQDMILVTTNELMDKIEKDTEQRLGKFSKGMPGLF